MPGIVVESCDDRPYGPGQTDYQYDKWRQEEMEGEMSVIWKFELELKDKQTVKMPKGAKIIHVETQFEKPCLWAIVDSSEETTDRVIGILPTGNIHFDAASVRHLGTFFLQGGAFVGHVVEPV